MGTFIQSIALGWLVYALTNSSLYLGVIAFSGQIPSLILTPIAGVYADRLNRRKVLIAVQTISMLAAFTMAILYLTGMIRIWHIMIIAIVNGLAMAFETPFRHAFLFEMVGGKELLQNAIALNSTLINAARFVGPMIGGFLIALLNEGYCFLINGISFLGVILALLSMRLRPQTRQSARLAAGRSYRRGEILLQLQAHTAFAATGDHNRFFGLSYQAFMPVFARDILHGDSQMLGLLTGTMGAGALTGAFYLASRRGICGIPKLILIAALTFSLSLMGFSMSENPLISLVLMFFVGFGMIVQFASTNTLIQIIVDEDKRGRVVALYGMSFMGITPIGSLLLGTVSPWAGIQYTILVAAFFCLLAALVYSRRLPGVKREVCK
jgi:MFS family permease